MSTLKEVDYQRLDKLLTQKKNLLGQYYALTEAQTEALAEKDTEKLIAQINQRQEIIEQIDIFRPELSALTEALDPQQLPPQTARLHEEIAQLLQKTQQLDQQNHQAAGSNLEFFRNEIRRLSETHKGVATYVQGGESFRGGLFDTRQ